MILATIFKSIMDNRTHRRLSFDSFDDFESMLQGIQKRKAIKPPKEDPWHPNAAELISPAYYKEGDKRRNANVVGWGGWAALDIDEYEGSFVDVLQKFKSTRCCIYSSASSKKGAEKCRVVFALDRHVMADQIKAFWYALNKEFSEFGDPQTKDLSRMYFVPANYPTSDDFFVSYDGDILNVDSLLSKHPYIQRQQSALDFPPEVLNRMRDFKLGQCTNRNFSWTSYKDCPFVNQRLVTEYKAITESGWYRKMYAIMVSIASIALKKGYPITESEITLLCQQLDRDTGGWYENRPLNVEAQRALSYAIQNL